MSLSTIYNEMCAFAAYYSADLVLEVHTSLYYQPMLTNTVVEALAVSSYF